MEDMKHGDPPVIKDGLLENPPATIIEYHWYIWTAHVFICFPIRTSIYGGFPFATFDHWRVTPYHIGSPRTGSDSKIDIKSLRHSQALNTLNVLNSLVKKLEDDYQSKLVHVLSCHLSLGLLQVLLIISGMNPRTPTHTCWHKWIHLLRTCPDLQPFQTMGSNWFQRQEWSSRFSQQKIRLNKSQMGYNLFFRKITSTIINIQKLIGALGQFFIFPDIGNFIIPTDEVHHFSEV